MNGPKASGLLYFPLHVRVIAGLLLGVGMLFLLIELEVIRYAYTRIGMTPAVALGFLAFSLIASYVNIPVYSFAGEQLTSKVTVRSFGLQWNVPSVAVRDRTVLAVNLGGAIAPTLLSIYLIQQKGMWWEAVIATALVASIVHVAARPVRGLGIAVPTFVPPLVTVATAVALSSTGAAMLAFSAGTLGTLIGADLTNLHKIRGLGAPVVSIGGAGTFDGIFMTGLLAVLLA